MDNILCPVPTRNLDCKLFLPTFVNRILPVTVPLFGLYILHCVFVDDNDTDADQDNDKNYDDDNNDDYDVDDNDHYDDDDDGEDVHCLALQCPVDRCSTRRGSTPTRAAQLSRRTLQI